MDAEAIGGLLGTLGVVVFGWIWPLRLAYRAAARAGRSPHWLWFGVYPFVAWIVWAVLRRQPQALRCSACDSPLKAGVRFCASCSTAVPLDATPAAEVSSVDWLRAQARCVSCSSPVKLAANACSSCGAAAPRVPCPKCGSEETATRRDRRAIWAAVLLLAPLGAVVNRYTDPRTGAIVPPATWGGAVEWIGALLPAIWAGFLVYRAFTPRGYVVRCSSCGATDHPPVSPALRSRTIPSGAGERAAVSQRPSTVAGAEARSETHAEPKPPVASADASPRATTAEARSLGTPDAVILADANQFLRYRAASRAKVDAQAALMDGLLTRPDAPPVKAVLLRSADPGDEFAWLIVKSGTQGSIAEMRAYAGFGPTFKSLFGDQPFSIVWADHIAENCPGPGEAVTPLGRERYARIAQDIRQGKYVVERHLGAARA